LHTIAIAYDETPSAQRALERGAELAASLGAKAVVVSVAPMLPGGPRTVGPVDPTDTPEQHRRELEHARAFLHERGVEGAYVTAVGDPAEAIVLVANEHGAELIVVGTRELGFVGRLLGQSVSAGVAHRAHTDVLIVHPPH
jgi:nucleotide-binding universal stress UspA family protein